MSTNDSRILRLFRYAHALFKGVALLLLILVFVNAFLLTFFRVDGHSMDTTLHNGQVVPLFEAAYWFRPPRLGDVVVVQYAGDTSIRFVKRIEGVPGDTVTVEGTEITLGPHQFYVEGDNRDHSTDSRVFGAVTADHILGRVLGVAPYQP